MILNDQIQIIYHPGTFGNLIKFILDRSLPTSKLKKIYNPFTTEGNLHQNFEYGNKFVNSHQLSFKTHKSLLEKNNELENTSKRILVTFDINDEIFIHKCEFYRIPQEFKNIPRFFWMKKSIKPPNRIFFVFYIS